MTSNGIMGDASMRAMHLSHEGKSALSGKVVRTALPIVEEGETLRLSSASSDESHDEMDRELSAMVEQNSKPFVVRELEAKARVYEERNALYGDNYKRFGQVLVSLFPQGLTLKTVADFNRFGILVQLIAKETRYAQNFTRGGHDDSLDDTSVYAMMLKELDTENRNV